ncbi:MAG TPA: sugar phosphate nucleotidyltransferase [Thermodesulfobacteriota bacterium]
MDRAKLKALQVSAEMTLKGAMQSLNETTEKILFVVNPGKKLIGTVTDGDIRRGLIKGLGFKGRVEEVMSRHFMALDLAEADRHEKAAKMMYEHKIEHIPVLDAKGRIKEVVSWTDFFKESLPGPRTTFLDNPVIIMAGGRGLRLDPFTRILPKPLIPIGEKSVLEIIMEKFHQSGFRNFIFTLNYKKEYIKTFLRENEFPYNIRWVEEDGFKGTAGALSLLKGTCTEPFIVSNCDVILDADFADILDWHGKSGNIMTIVGCHREIKIPYGVLEMEDERLKSFIEKPNYDVIINTGVYVLNPEVVSLIGEGQSMDMNVLIERASEKGKVSVYPVGGGWLDVGQWDEYRDSIRKLREVS